MSTLANINTHTEISHIGMVFYYDKGWVTIDRETNNSLNPSKAC